MSIFGSSLDDFLKEGNLLAEAKLAATKRVLAFQIQQIMERDKFSKTAMTKRMHTSRSALDRPLSPSKTSVTFQTLERAAQALGKKIRIELAG